MAHLKKEVCIPSCCCFAPAARMPMLSCQCAVVQVAHLNAEARTRQCIEYCKLQQQLQRRDLAPAWITALQEAVTVLFCQVLAWLVTLGRLQPGCLHTAVLFCTTVCAWGYRVTAPFILQCFSACVHLWVNQIAAPINLPDAFPDTAAAAMCINVSAAALLKTC